LLRRLIDPASETAIPADFKAIADEKSISIWRNFIMYPDEMGWASKSNVETIKNVISADTVMRRPMTTNQGEEIRQNATFIGSANVSDISEIIRDVTGTRRFIGLRTRDKLDWDVVNNTDYIAIWQCVDQEADDPTSHIGRSSRLTGAGRTED
jgi:predicted P-loop ATPase